MNKEITVKDGVVILEVLQGVAFSFALDSADADWPSYEDLVIEVKGKNDLNLRPILRLDLNGGLAIAGTRLLVSIPESAFIQSPISTLAWDLKGKKSGTIIPIIPGEIRINNTVTKI